MGIRHWLRKKRAEQAEDEQDGRAPSGSIISAIFGREAPTLHALGEFDQTTYPGELQDLLRRREDVAEELREMDLTTRQSRIDAIPRLHLMLRTYPHPLAYEVLIHAYVDAGRWDEARGAAFAARERRTQVSRSPYSEIRAEIDRLKEWTPEEVELLRQEREAAPAPAFSPARPVRAAEPAKPIAAAPPAEPVAVPAPEPVPAPAPVEPVSVPAPAPVAVPGPASPVAVAEPFRASEPARRAEPVDSADAAAAPHRIESEFVDPGEPADPAGLSESLTMGEPLDTDTPADGVVAAGGGGAAPRQGGSKGGKSRGRRGPRGRK
ncbi:MAG TPA: hypothetical protein VE871_06440 [Longimicrobium sp.]|nr:hypothetical protein [Longimicrobium sp.]